MKDYKRILIAFVGIIFWVIMIAPIAQPGENEAENDLKIKHLQEIVPKVPAVINGEALDLMYQAAKTKRLDAAMLLIKCLAFNFDPTISNEERRQDMMIPAIQLLKDHFGETVAPLLYAEAIASDQKWFRDRSALAARTILSPEVILKMNNIFALESTLNPNAKDFAASLIADTIDIHFAIPSEKKLKEVEDAVKKIRKKTQVK